MIASMLLPTEELTEVIRRRMDIFVYKDKVTGVLYFFLERQANEMEYVGRSTIPISVEWPVRPEAESMDLQQGS